MTPVRGTGYRFTSASSFACGSVLIRMGLFAHRSNTVPGPSGESFNGALVMSVLPQIKPADM
ncbi:hypothetical protein [Pseudochrobactrum sp. MP213Fo]|uniref:hypothetical protein n=1 Tax=Pseudochrobactrum sp. MP213Fo TaxID=3022250 RepID=UPI003BA34EBE